MAPASAVPLQPENTAFLKELQWKENRSQDEFLGNLLSDEKLAKDHIALKHSNSSSSGGGPSHVSKNLPTNPVIGNTSKAVDDPQIYTQLSVNLWKRINAGYLIPRQPPAGVMRSVFTYEPDMIEHQSKEFHRKRDFYSEYNEAAARFKLVHGNKKPLSKPKRVVKGGEDANTAQGRLSPPPPSVESMPFDGVQSGYANADSNLNINQNEQKPIPTTTTNAALSSNPSVQNSAPTTTSVEAQPPS